MTDTATERRAHHQMVAVLEGDHRANASTGDTKVVLDLRTFAADIATTAEPLASRYSENTGDAGAAKPGATESRQPSVRGLPQALEHQIHLTVAHGTQ